MYIRTNILQYVSIAAATFAGIDLFLNYFSFRRQQKNLQVNLLEDFAARYFSLIEKQEENMVWAKN